MAFVVVMTMALATAAVLVPCAGTLMVKSAGGGLQTRKTRKAATDARARAIFGDYGITAWETSPPPDTIRPIRRPVMQYVSAVALRDAS